jgi:glycosyltransferase involved in cell wall biosynthesis
VKILDVSPRVAYPPRIGSSVRTYHLLRGLARHHEVRQYSLGRLDGSPFRGRVEEVLAAPGYTEHSVLGGPGSWITEISERCWPGAPVLAGARLRFSRPKELSRLLRETDLTIVEFPWAYAYCRSRRPEGPFVLSAHNVEARKFPSYARAAGKSGRRDAWVRYIERAERRAISECDLVLAVSDDDRQKLVRRYSVPESRVVVVPNGADTERLREFSDEERRRARKDLGLPDRPTVVFVGSNVPPNRAAHGWIERAARNCRRFTFLVVGPVASRRAAENLVAAGLVDDVLPYLRAADFSLCPIEHGGGTKIKLLEALAAGLPTVAFPESVLGLPLRDGVDVVVAEKSDSAIASALTGLAAEPARAKRIGRAATELIAERFGWVQIADDLARELEARFGPGRDRRTAPGPNQGSSPRSRRGKKPK